MLAESSFFLNSLIVSDTFRERAFCLFACLTLEIAYPNDEVISFGNRIQILGSNPNSHTSYLCTDTAQVILMSLYLGFLICRDTCFIGLLYFVPTKNFIYKVS